MALSVVLGATGVAKLLAVLGSGDRFVIPLPVLLCVAACEVLIAGGVLSTGRPIYTIMANVMGMMMLAATLSMVYLGVDIRRCGCLGRVELDAASHGWLALSIVTLSVLADGGRART